MLTYRKQSEDFSRFTPKNPSNSFSISLAHEISSNLSDAASHEPNVFIDMANGKDPDVFAVARLSDDFCAVLGLKSDTEIQFQMTMPIGGRRNFQVRIGLDAVLEGRIAFTFPNQIQIKLSADSIFFQEKSERWIEDLKACA